MLLAKVLDLNETQTAVLSLVFRFCDDRDLPLLDLADLRTTLRFLTSDEGKPVLEEYGGISKASVGVVLRSILTLEEAGADAFFGEPAPRGAAAPREARCRTHVRVPSRKGDRMNLLMAAGMRRRGFLRLLGRRGALGDGRGQAAAG